MPTLDDILNADKPSDLFSPSLDEKTAQKRYQRLLRIAHPDVNPARKHEAEKAFTNLNKIWSIYIGRTSGTKKNTIRTKKHDYTFEKKRYQIDGVAYYDATFDAGHEDAFLMFTTKPEMNSSFIDSLKNMKAVRANADEKVKGFFPEILDSFLFNMNGANVASVAMGTEESFKSMYTLRDVLVDYPQGIAAKDVAWMFRRMLIALAETHKAGYVHGTPYIDAFMIHPERHGLILKDWQYSVPLGQPPRLLNKDALLIYPTDITEYKPLQPKTDVSIAAHAALKLLGETNTDVRFTRFLKGMANYPTLTAKEGIIEFDELIEELWGERSWHYFKMKRAY